MRVRKWIAHRLSSNPSWPSTAITVQTMPPPTNTPDAQEFLGVGRTVESRRGTTAHRCHSTASPNHCGNVTDHCPLTAADSVHHPSHDSLFPLTSFLPAHGPVTLRHGRRRPSCRRCSPSSDGGRGPDLDLVRHVPPRGMNARNLLVSLETSVCEEILLGRDVVRRDVSWSATRENRFQSALDPPTLKHGG